MEGMKSDNFRDGLNVSLHGKFNLYANTNFRGWVEKAIEQERLDMELEEAESQNENKRVKFTSESEGNTKNGGNYEL